MMGEERAHDVDPRRVGRDLAVGGEGPARRVVERLVEPEAPRRALAGQAAEVRSGGRRVDHGRQRGGVGRDHQVLGEPALESQAGDAEGLVLIVAVRVHAR